jgi:hypothetical protein
VLRSLNASRSVSTGAHFNAIEKPMTEAPNADPLIEQLLDAARREAPRPRVKERALRNARRPSSGSGRGRWLLAALALGGVASWFFLGGEPPRTEIQAEHRWTVTHGHRADEKAAQLGTKPVATPAPSVIPTPPPKTKVRPVTLEAELAMLDHARQALAQGDANQALAELDTYDRRATARRLGAEAALLRIQILSAGGRQQEASALAVQFVTDHRDSPLTERARTFVLTPTQTNPRSGELP